MCRRPCIDVCCLCRRLRIASASSSPSSAYRLRIVSVACASPPSSSVHRLRIVSISPHLRIASALSPICPRHYKLAVYDDVISKVFSLL
ncbi:hypothetical protein Bca101_093502 [Brassica carinata]